MCSGLCPQSTNQTTWWAATDLEPLTMTSWPRWRRRLKAWWPAATTSSNQNLPTTTSTTTCPGSGTSTSRKTGKTKRGLCVGAEWNRSPSPVQSSATPSPPVSAHCPPFLPSCFYTVMHFMLSCLIYRLRCLITPTFLPISLSASVAAAIAAVPPSIHPPPAFLRFHQLHLSHISSPTYHPPPHWPVPCQTSSQQHPRPRLLFFLLLEEINPTFHCSRMVSSSQYEVHVEKQLYNQLLFAFFI